MPSPSTRALTLLTLLAPLACTSGAGDDEIAETSSASESSSSSESSSASESSSSGESSSTESSSSSTDDSSSTESSASESSTDESGASESTTDESGSASESSESGSESTTGGSENPLWLNPSLWYSIDNRLMYLEIDPLDGSVVQLQVSTITADPALVLGQSGITVVLDEFDELHVLLTRINANSTKTELHHIANPPTDGSPVQADHLGTIPNNLKIEALYTDCQGLVYLMDTGSDVSNANGNRLIRFTGDYLAGDLAYEVITDLQNAEVADIDDMGPGIDAMGEITDGTGFAIDSGTVHLFDYNTGTGDVLGQAGTYGVHALGGPLFADATARLYVLDIDAHLYQADPLTLALSDILVTGPAPIGGGTAGWSGLSGPLTQCESTLPDPQ
jgi:hypothetical protein